MEQQASLNLSVLHPLSSFGFGDAGPYLLRWLLFAFRRKPDGFPVINHHLALTLRANSTSGDDVLHQ